MKSKTGFSLALAAWVLLEACSARLPRLSAQLPAREFLPRPELAVDLPDQFAASEVAGPREALAWWESFADPILNRVVEAALESNYNLAQAVARVDQARARARIAGAGGAPLIDPLASAVDLDMPTNAGIGAQLDELGLDSVLEDEFGVSLPNRIGVTTYGLGTEFAYEADFWGRGRNRRLAAGAEQLASEADLVAARISVLAETVRTYLELVDLRRQRLLGERNIGILGEQESRARARYESGLIEAPTLYARRRALRDARARLPQIEAGLAEAENRLWILLGGYRDDISAILPDALSVASGAAPVPAGIPAQLLHQRPDVASARQRVDAARFALGARRAELLPTLSLSGSIGLRATELGDWFDANQWFSNLGVNLLGPMIQGSRLRNEVELAQAQLNEAAAAWGHSVVTAVHEVEATLAGLAAERRRYQIMLAYLEEAEAEYGLRQQRYAAGVGSYEATLTAEQALIDAEAVLATRERDLGFAQLALHRALGGAWTAADVGWLQPRQDEVETASINTVARPVDMPSPPRGEPEQNIRDAPGAATTLTGAMLEERQITTPSDLQMNSPGISFAPNNFGGYAWTIRGIGRLVMDSTGDAGVATHFNDIPVESNLVAMELFDMERVEILRGPQGTLYGRNATGGAINFLTAMPDHENFAGSLDFEYGDFNHQRVKGMFNIPFSGNAGLRLAGFRLGRDGYVKNLAYGQIGTDDSTLWGIDDNVDGRASASLRATFSWDFSERGSLWAQHGAFREDDDRLRINNQVCARNPYPTTGCLPDEFGFESPNLSTNSSGIYTSGAGGALPFGADGSDPSLYVFPRPAMDSFREMHTDLEPLYMEDEDLWLAGLSYAFDDFRVGLRGGRQNRRYTARQDYLMDVGATLGPTPLNPQGLWPTSSPAAALPGADWLSDNCNLNAGSSGIFGDCVLRVSPKRAFAFDQVGAGVEYWTAEARLESTLDGRFNFQAGVDSYEWRSHNDHYVIANVVDQIGYFGSPLLQAPPLYPTVWISTSDPEGGTIHDGWAAFGETWFDISDEVRLTLGLRYHRDNKELNDTIVSFNSANANAALQNLFGPDPIWIRAELFGDLFAQALGQASGPGENSARLLEFWDAQGAYAENAPTAISGLSVFGIFQGLQSGALSLSQASAALAELPPVFRNTVPTLISQDAAAIAQDPGLAALAGALRNISAAVPLVPGFGETRFLTGSPTRADWNGTSGRIGIDWQISDNALVYGFYSRGYKPGGFNLPVPPAEQSTMAFTFGPEKIDTIEIGGKNTLLNNRLMLNGTFFLYDYSDLQVRRILNGSAIIDNIEADIMGIELEGLWQPEALPGLSVDFEYGWLDARVAGAKTIDSGNRTGNDPTFVQLSNIDPGPLTGVNYVARESQLTQQVVDQALAERKALDIRNGVAQVSVSYPVNANGVSVPVFFSRNFLDAMGVETQHGIPVDLDGNQLPNSPEHTLRLGFAYTLDLPAIHGSLTARWDSYWQDDSYARHFNAGGDWIDSWTQHNAMLVYNSDDGFWDAKAWIRNIGDAENVTGKFLASDGSGFFRNYFLTEPRLFGISLRMNFGD